MCNTVWDLPFCFQIIWHMPELNPNTCKCTYKLEHFFFLSCVRLYTTLTPCYLSHPFKGELGRAFAWECLHAATLFVLCLHTFGVTSCVVKVNWPPRVVLIISVLHWLLHQGGNFYFCKWNSVEPLLCHQATSTTLPLFCSHAAVEIHLKSKMPKCIYSLFRFQIALNCYRHYPCNKQNVMLMSWLHGFVIS